MPDSTALAIAITDRITAQWIALGGQLAGIDDRTPVDIDALVAATAAQQNLDPRVLGVAIDWCVKYGSTVHTGRLRRITDEFGADHTALAEFAGQVASAGGPRWPFAGAGLTAMPRGKVLAKDLRAPARIAWRIRSAFGVTARSDVLFVLLTTPPVPVSVSDLAARARYSKRNIALAVAGMALAEIVVKRRVGNEDRISLDPGSPLRTLFDADGVPDIDWASRWTVLFRLDQIEAATKDSSQLVRLVETRRETEALVPLLGPSALPYPQLSAVGEAWGRAFDTWLEHIHTVMTLMSA